MQIRVKTLTFTRQSDGGPAIPIRKAPGAHLPLHDWQRSPLRANAVAFARTAEQPVTVDVEFEVDEPVNGTVSVRARETGGGPLGDVEAQRIPAARLRQVNQFRVLSNGLSTPGVTSASVTWNWEFSIDGRNFLPAQATTHEIFVLLDTPKGPWTNEVRLWKDVLVRACQWAEGMKSFNGCTERIVSNVYGLGGRLIPISDDQLVIVYNSASTFSRGEPAYDLVAFLRTAAQDRDSENMMNCQDCAGAVALLSAALGCDLRVAEITPGNGRKEFRTTRIQLIGEDQKASTTFEFHQVNATVSPGGALNDRLWDACLKLDVAPGRKQTYELATGMPRLAVGEKAGYEPQLIARDEPPMSVRLGAGNGVPRPVWVRDAFEPVILPDGPIVPEPPLEVLPAESPEAIRIRERLLPGVEARGSEFQNADGRRQRLSIARVRAKFNAEADLYAWLVTSETADDAQKTFDAMNRTVNTVLKPIAQSGDRSLLCDDVKESGASRTVLLRCGNTVLRLVNDRKHRINIQEEAARFRKDLDEIVSQR